MTITPSDKLKIESLLTLHRKIYNTLDVMVPPLIKALIKPTLDDMAKMTAPELATALKPYKYAADKVFGYNIPVVQPPTITVIRAGCDKRGAGNCNDSAKLIEAVRGATVFCFLSEIKNLTDAGHFVAIKGSEVWSNFMLYKDPFKEIKQTASQFVKDWEYIIEISKDFKATGIITR